MSGISGFPSSQKKDLGAGKTNNFATVIPSDPFRNSLDTNRFVFRVGNPLVPVVAGANTGIQNVDGVERFFIHSPSTPARRGDIIRFEDGNAAYIEFPIISISDDGDYILIPVTQVEAPAQQAPMPAAGDSFYVLRHTTQRVDDTGSQLVIAQPGPSQFVLDGVDTEVEEDTAVPANNKPFPVKVFDENNLPTSPATEVTANAILAEIMSQATADLYETSVRLDYSVSNVSNAAWTELIADTGPDDIREITLFDGGGFAMELGIGAATAEVRKLLIPPGGFNGKFSYRIPANSRLSIRAVGSALVNAGEIDINLFI